MWRSPSITSPDSRGLTEVDPPNLPGPRPPPIVIKSCHFRNIHRFRLTGIVIGSLLEQPTFRGNPSDAYHLSCGCSRPVVQHFGPGGSHERSCPAVDD